MLEVDGLSVRYGAIHAVQGVSLTVSEGEIVALLGPNGAGKTSLISAVVGLVPTAGGSVRFNNEDVTRLETPERVRRGMTVTPEGRRVFPTLTVTENLVLGGAARRDEAGVRGDMNRCFEMFPILRDRRNQPAGTLSGGEQQMLAIARSLMSKPKLLMLDEPSLGLAPRLVEQIFELVKGLRSLGLTLLVVEQNAVEALRFSDRAYVMNTGVIGYAGPAAELRSSPELMRAYLGLELG